MKALLKCYYGYQNRGDELLFFGVVSYLFDQYEGLTSLDVEVGDVSWMHEWCERNPGLREQYQSRVRFVTSRRFSMWIADYDMIYLGGGEVLASKTRSFWHGGVNYLALFWRWIYSGRVVWLGGIETPSVWWSKLLYRMMLPYAQQIVCREQGSYDIVAQYTDQVVLYHDWAIDVLEQDKEEGQGEDGGQNPEKSERESEKSGKTVVGCRDTISACPNSNDTTLALEKKQKVILLHSKDTDSQGKRYPWFREQMINVGYDVIVPDLPKSNNPILDEWLTVIDTYQPDSNTILIGHSRGGVAALRWLETRNQSVAKTILVATNGGLIGPMRSEKESNGFYTQQGYDFAIIKKYAGDITHFHSIDDQRVAYDQGLQNHQGLGGKFLSYEDKQHFGKNMNGIFPELIEEIIGYDEQRTARVAVPTNERDGLPRHSCLVPRNDDNNEQKYILINFIPRHTTPEIIQQFHEWMQDYPDHQIINFPAEEGDVLPDEIVAQYGDRIQTRQRWDPGATGTGHAISDTLTVFQQADAGFGQRLHFIIACVYYRIPIFHTSYSEKVDKILQFFATEL